MSLSGGFLTLVECLKAGASDIGKGIGDIVCCKAGVTPAQTQFTKNVLQCSPESSADSLFLLNTWPILCPHHVLQDLGPTSLRTVAFLVHASGSSSCWLLCDQHRLFCLFVMMSEIHVTSSYTVLNIHVDPWPIACFSGPPFSMPRCPSCI